MLKRKLEEFEILNTIGTGTVGTIYRASDKKNDREVALKILLPTVSDNELIVSRFEREMYILEMLSHPNIVQYFGGGRDGKQMFFAMELVPGATLKEVLNESGPLSWREAATVAVQICSALQHAHNHGIIHRDLKPANLLFTESGEVKLSDFGIALDANATTITNEGLTVGSYHYMSPEQVLGERSITGQTDLYALGCVLFETLTGRPPYLGENFAQIFEQHLHSSPPSILAIQPSCPAEIDAIVKRLLEKSPDARPFNARNVQGSLIEILDPSPSESSENESTVSDEEDVPASQAVTLGRESLSNRLTQIHEHRDNRDISWPTLAGILLLILVIACAAWFFSA